MTNKAEGKAISKAAFLSLHTSPLAQPGTGDGGGMNVYIRELVSSLAQAGVVCRVYVRRWAAELPEVVPVEPGFEVVHVPAGPAELPKEELRSHVDEFAQWVANDLDSFEPHVVHANYWLSGVAGRILKQRLQLPLLTTFHTLARVKAETGDHEPQRRVAAEAEVIRCSDVITASCEPEAQQLEHLYGAEPDRIEIVTPGVEHALFSPGDQGGARAALGLGPGPLLLFVGRIQPLKGLDVAVRALAELHRPDARLVVVGGASGQEGEAEVQRVRRIASDLGVADRIEMVEPQPHHLLSTYYRAADVCLVPSRSESFGLVALEAAACGLPVVAAAVGGLRTIVHHGHTGFLVEGRDPAVFAAYAAEVLESPILAAEMAFDAADGARAYTWASTARSLVKSYGELLHRVPVNCS